MCNSTADKQRIVEELQKDLDRQKATMDREGPTKMKGDSTRGEKARTTEATTDPTSRANPLRPAAPAAKGIRVPGIS